MQNPMKSGRFTYRNLSLMLSLFVNLGISETILQEFNSMTELNAFWDLSSWANFDRTHSPQNVSIENGVLVLKLSGSQPGTIPVCAEITSKRTNFKYGSYSASIKTSKTPGGVVGWFIYRDAPLNEIDVEMLTKDNRDLHFTLHHIQVNVDYKLTKLDFDPSLAFHEYRFDWYAGRVEYFVDGKSWGTLTKNVPDMESQIMLNHWSGNIADWGGTAPTQDMYMYVDYMRYSSDYPAPTGVLPAKPGASAQPAISFRRNGNQLTIQWPPGLSPSREDRGFSLVGKKLPRLLLPESP